MAINKVIYGNSTLIDLTSDTVSASTLLDGETAHDRSGASIVGTATNINNIPSGTTDIVDADTILTKQNSNSTWYQKTFSKVWDYIKGKLGIASSGDTFLKKDGTWATPTDNKVEQQDWDGNYSYRVLFSYNANDNLSTNKVYKHNSFIHNPNSALTYIIRRHTGTEALDSRLNLGNATVEGSEGANYGALRLYGKGEYYTQLYDNNNVLTDNRGLYLPNRTGTIATSSLIAKDETALTTVGGVKKRVASQAYSTGDHFVINNYFCTATTDIASGAELTENTNYVVETDLASAIETELAGKLDNSQATMGNYLIIERSTTTSADNPATLSFKTNDTTANVTNYSRVYAYSPHSGTGGNNLVINAVGKLYCGGGESPKNLYDNHKELGVSMTNEVAYFTSDSHLYVLANGNTITDAKGFILTTGFNLTPYGFKTDVSPNAWGQLDNAGNIGTSSYRWASGNFVALNATTLNGQTIGSAPDFGDTTYTFRSDDTAYSITIYHEKSNGGSATLEYLSLPNDYNRALENTIAYVNAKGGTTLQDKASKAYSKGDIFYHKGSLNVAKTAIADEADLTSSNTQAISIADYLTVNTKDASIASGITWITFNSNGSKCYRSGNHVSCQLYVNVSTAQTITSATTIITLPYTMYGRPKFGQINKVSGNQYPLVTDISVYISANSKNVQTRGDWTTGNYYISFDYLTTDPI